MKRRVSFVVFLLAVVLISGGQLAQASRQSAPANSTLLNGLMGYWTMDETSRPGLDSSERANHLSESGSVPGVAGKVGNAASITRAGNEYLTRDDNADLSEGDNDFTIASWFYLHTEATTTYGSDSASFFT